MGRSTSRGSGQMYEDGRAAGKADWQSVGEVAAATDLKAAGVWERV